jgi:microcystin degradation protein MlrC
VGSANDIMDGFRSGLSDPTLTDGLDVTALPLCFVDGNTNQRPLSAGVVHGLLERSLLQPLRDAVAQHSLDGVLLSLHGSFWADGDDDVDGTVLERVRGVVGPSCIVIAVNDQHSNITDRMVNHADALFIERTYPHTDMAERAQAAVALLMQTLRGEVRPVMAWCPVPLLWSAPRMITAEQPALSYVQQLEALDADDRILTASVGVGYQWQDHPFVGASAVVVADGSNSVAQDAANELGGWLFDRKRDWAKDSVSAEEALALGEAAGRYPIVLADQGDNPGGGAPSDSTEVLRLFKDRGLAPAAVLYICDPEAAEYIHAAGRDATVQIDIGGKSSDRFGPPVHFEAAKVVALSDGRFVYDGPMYGGKQEELGLSAHIEQDGLHVVVISLPVQPFDMALSRSLDLDCTTLKYLLVKSTGHFRSGFEPIAGSIYNIDTNSLLPQDWSKIDYKRIPALFPVIDHVAFQPRAQQPVSGARL